MRQKGEQGIEDKKVEGPGTERSEPKPTDASEKGVDVESKESASE